MAETTTWMLNEITKRTGGKVEFEFYWSQSLLKDADLTSGCGSGIADLVLVGASQTVDRNPLWCTLDLPANGSNIWALVWGAYETLHENPDVKKEFDALNVVPTYGYSSGLFFVETKKKATTLEDLKGLRIRSYGGAFGHYLEHAGMVPVQVSIADIYDTISRGVLDGAMSVWSFTGAMKFYEVAPNIVMPERLGMVASATVLINKDRWDEFPDSLRKIISDATRGFNDRFSKSLMDSEANIKKTLTAEHGVEVHQLSAQENAKLEEGAKKAQEEWFERYREKGVPAKAVWNDFQARVQKYEAEAEAKGYPWER
jgi:TRAP-type C4-dicarboxylate transport system substrate-binding protein